MMRGTFESPLLSLAGMDIQKICRCAKKKIKNEIHIRRFKLRLRFACSLMEINECACCVR